MKDRRSLGEEIGSHREPVPKALRDVLLQLAGEQGVVVGTDRSLPNFAVENGGDFDLTELATGDLSACDGEAANFRRAMFQ